MARYAVTLKDRTVEVIDGADAYQQEGQMTTFFALDRDRRVVDCWSTRLASFRSSEIMIIRRDEDWLTVEPEPRGQGTYAPNQAMDDSATSPPPSTAMVARSTCGGRITTARANTSGKALIP
jgi:hypothetical protein